MAIKNTLLSETDLGLLESAIVNHGKIVSVDNLKKDVKKRLGNRFSNQILRNQLSALTKKGWLVRLKRGVYLVVTDISTLGMSDVSDYVIAATLSSKSYVSFEAALQYHNMFDQKLLAIDSVTTERNRTYKVAGNKEYRFLHVASDLFFGSTEVTDSDSGRTFAVADAEKALLDMLYSRADTFSSSLVLEKLTNYGEDLDIKKLSTYALSYSTTVIRKIGFLLDEAGKDSNMLLSDKIKGNTYSKLGDNAKVFNAKWRLYYDDKLTH